MRNIRPSRRRGAALIVVLWVVGMLSIMIGSMAFDAHLEARITSYARKRTRAAHLARSGIDVAEMLIRRRVAVTRGHEKTAEDEQDRWYDSKQRLSQGLAIRGLTEALGGGEIALDIVPEPARRNVNKLTVEDWERVLEVADVPEELWAGLIDSVTDWTDADSVPRADGAETEDYYETLDAPYRAKNGPLDTVDELLLVKGFTRPILFGGELKIGPGEKDVVAVTGIEDLLTTYGDGKVNVNACTDRILRTLPGVDEVVAGAIIEEREGWKLQSGEREDTSFRGVDDFAGRIPGLNPQVRSAVTVDSSIYRITSIGTVGGVSREIRCIGEVSARGLRILRWVEDE